jgi:3-oxoacyl-[acyl-carrier protein] reductase
MNIRFDDRSVIVTGAAHGFGRAIALRFAHLGARVIACDIVAEELAETARLAEALQTPLTVCVLDVTDRAAVQAMRSDASTFSSTMPAACSARWASRLNT